MRKNKYAVRGEYGGYFSSMKDARLCAKEASLTEEYNYSATIELLEDGFNYIDYEHGKCVRDGWTRKKNTSKKIRKVFTCRDSKYCSYEYIIIRKKRHILKTMGWTYKDALNVYRENNEEYVKFYGIKYYLQREKNISNDYSNLIDLKIIVSELNGKIYEYEWKYLNEFLSETNKLFSDLLIEELTSKNKEILEWWYNKSCIAYLNELYEYCQNNIYK